MANKFEFFFTKEAIESLLNEDIKGIIVSGEVMYVAPSLSNFLIYAEGYDLKATGSRVAGCPMPCSDTNDGN
jgi:hypothetical protein